MYPEFPHTKYNPCPGSKDTSYPHDASSKGVSEPLEEVPVSCSHKSVPATASCSLSLEWKISWGGILRMIFGPPKPKLELEAKMNC